MADSSAVSIVIAVFIIMTWRSLSGKDAKFSFVIYRSVRSRLMIHCARWMTSSAWMKFSTIQRSQEFFWHMFRIVLWRLFLYLKVSSLHNAEHLLWHWYSLCTGMLNSHSSHSSFLGCRLSMWCHRYTLGEFVSGPLIGVSMLLISA